MSELDPESIATLIKSGATALSVALGSKPAALFIEKVSGMVGWAMDPLTIKRKARAEAAASLIKAETDQAIKSLEQRTASRILYEEDQFQQNIESIVLKALANIKDNAKPEMLDNDWLLNFSSKCRFVSDEEVQKLWSHILSGETNVPGTFSPKTLHLLSTLTKQDILAFKRMCSFVWIDETDKPVLIVNEYVIGDADVFSQLNLDVLRGNESGLSIFSTVEEKLYGTDVYFIYNERKFEIREILDGNEVSTIDSGIPVGYVKLTLEGRELAKICKPDCDEKYMNSVLESWRNRDLSVIESVIHDMTI